MSKRLVLRGCLFAGALVVSVFTALMLERYLPFPTPGETFTEFVATRVWRQTGGDLLGHSIEIIVLTDTLVCFALLYFGWTSLAALARRRRSKCASE